MLSLAASCGRAALRIGCEARETHARCLCIDEDRCPRTNATAVSRSGARQCIRARRVFGVHGAFEGLADVPARQLCCALCAIPIPGELVRGDSWRTCDR